MIRNSKKVKIGNIYIGGGEKIAVQSMLNKPASDIEGSVAQAVALEKAGCEIIRAAVPDMAAVKLIEKLKENLTVPVVADIHFDYRLALASIDAGTLLLITFHGVLSRPRILKSTIIEPLSVLAKATALTSTFSPFRSTT